LAGNKNFALLLIGQTISTIGDWISYFALLILAYRLSNSALAISLLLIWELIPTFILGPVVGVYVDRWNKKRILVVADLIRGFLVLLLPFVRSVYEIYMVIFLLSIVSSFFEPARVALLPRIVQENQLLSANSLFSMLSTIAMTLGPLIGGVLITATNVHTVFYVDSVSFFVSALAITLILSPVTKEESKSIKANQFAVDFKDILEYIKRTPFIRHLLMVSALVMIGYGSYNAIEVVFAKEVIQASDLDFSIMLLAGGLGLALGAWFAGNKMKDNHIPWALAAGVLISGITLSIIPQLKSVTPIVLCNLVGGFGDAFFLIGIQTLIQKLAPANFLGRLFSIRAALNNGILIASMILAGFLADLAGARFVLTITGGIVLLAIIPGIALIRSLATSNAITPLTEDAEDCISLLKTVDTGPE
jgi:MFS family permease